LWRARPARCTSPSASSFVGAFRLDTATVAREHGGRHSVPGHASPARRSPRDAQRSISSCGRRDGRDGRATASGSRRNATPP
jgi:hypothetical protein